MPKLENDPNETVDNKEQEKLSHDEMAKLLMEKHTFKTLTDTEEILKYDTKQGVYRSNGEIIIKYLVEKWLRERGQSKYATTGFMNEVMGHIRRSTYIYREKVNAKTHLINFKNGIYNLRTGKFSPHTPELLSTVQIPVNYDSEANCPRIRQFFSEIVAEESVLVLEEIFGWCLDVDSLIQRTVFLVGEGANGKSTYLNLLRAFLGGNNCSATALQSFTVNRFAASQLYGKLANIHPDLPNTTMNDTGVLKALTGGDALTAEKKFQHQFTFTNKAKLIFSANQLPEINDDTMATWRRVILIEFPYEFSGDRKDPNILKKLTTDEELSGLLNIALDVLKSLQERGDFSYKPTWKDIREKYIARSDTVRVFIEKDCVLDPLAEIPKPDLFKAYCEFCKVEKIPAGTSRGFGRKLKKKFSRVIYERANNWSGVRLRIKKAK